jgi:hypothetical protein
MARSSVAAAMSFWLARGGVFGLLTSKSALMRSRACLPSSRARSPRAEASPAMEARSSRTARYSSAILPPSSCAWARCALMSAPLAGEVGARLAPSPGVVHFPGSRGLLRHQPLPRSRRRLGRRRPPRSTHVRGRSFRRWSRRSSRTSRPRRRETAGTPLGPTRQRSPIPRIHARWRATARWRSRGRTHRWWRQ